MPRQLASFGGTSLAIEHTGERAAEVVDFLFRHIDWSDDAAPPHAHYRLQPDAGGALVITRNGEIIFREVNDAEVAECFLGESSFDLADRVCSGLVLHSGGLAKDGRGLLFTGPSGCGKTTLVTHLFSQGFDFLSDEFIFVPDGGDTIQGLTRPLNIKRPAVNILKDYIRFESMADAILRGTISYLVPPEVVRPENNPEPVRPCLLIFPRYKDNARCDCQPLPKARAALELMKCLLNARNLPAHGFHAVSTLVKQLPAYTLHYSSLDQAAEQIDTLLGQHF